MCLRIASALLLLISLPTPALAVDRTEPIHIESDSLDIDDVKGVSAYRGNVVFRQGPNRLWADEIVIYVRDREALEKIEAKGQPARFRVVPETGEEAASGEADLIEYRDAAGIMLLKGHARVRQGGHELAGDVIEYDTAKRTVRGGKQVDAQARERVRVTIQPRQAQPETDASPAP